MTEDEAYHNLIKVETKQEVVALLDNLKPDEALILKKHHLEEKTFAQIAKEIDKSENTIKTTYYRALRKLRKEGGERYE